MMYGKPLKLLLQLACTGLLLTVIERQLFWGQIRQLGKFSSASSLSLVDGVCGGWRTFFFAAGAQKLSCSNEHTVDKTK